MSNTTLHRLLTSALVAVTLCGGSFAQWSTDPNNNLIVGYGLLPEICSDSAGGVYVTYQNSVVYPQQIALRRVNRYGYQVWGNERLIVGQLPASISAKVTSDWRRGIIVGFMDWQSIGQGNVFRVRVQRVDSSGNLLWGPTGVRVSVAEESQTILGFLYEAGGVVADGSGGCIVAWADTLGRLWMQRIDSGGTRAWGDSGRVISDSLPSNLMVSDGRGGCILVYGGGRLQRIDRDGNLLWGGGVRVPTGASVIRAENNGPIYLLGGCFLGYRGGQSLFTINHQKLDSAGALMWDSLGVTLDTLNTNNYVSLDFSLQDGYSTIAWPQNIGGVWDLRTQIVRSDGSTVFQYGGIPVSSVSSRKNLYGVVPSDSNTSIFIWVDNRSSGGIYAQRIDSTGQKLWSQSDVALFLISIGGLRIGTDGNGGAIVVGWREFDLTVRAQQVSRYGNLGEVVTSIHDDWLERMPDQVVLYQNYPNPFNARTLIRFDLARSGLIKLEVFNLLGQCVRTLIDEFYTAGSYHVAFETDDLASGVYLIKLHAQETLQTRKLVIIK